MAMTSAAERMVFAVRRNYVLLVRFQAPICPWPCCDKRYLLVEYLLVSLCSSGQVLKMQNFYFRATVSVLQHGLHSRYSGNGLSEVLATPVQTGWAKKVGASTQHVANRVSERINESLQGFTWLSITAFMGIPLWPNSHPSPSSPWAVTGHLTHWAANQNDPGEWVKVGWAATHQGHKMLVSHLDKRPPFHAVATGKLELARAAHLAPMANQAACSLDIFQKWGNGSPGDSNPGSGDKEVTSSATCAKLLDLEDGCFCLSNMFTGGPRDCLIFPFFCMGSSPRQDAYYAKVSFFFLAHFEATLFSHPRLCCSKDWIQAPSEGNILPLSTTENSDLDGILTAPIECTKKLLEVQHKDGVLEERLLFDRSQILLSGTSTWMVGQIEPRMISPSPSPIEPKGARETNEKKEEWGRENFSLEKGLSVSLCDGNLNRKEDIQALGSQLKLADKASANYEALDTGVQTIVEGCSMIFLKKPLPVLKPHQKPSSIQGSRGGRGHSGWRNNDDEAAGNEHPTPASLTCLTASQSRVERDSRRITQKRTNERVIKAGSLLHKLRPKMRRLMGEARLRFTHVLDPPLFKTEQRTWFPLGTNQRRWFEYQAIATPTPE
ncbi:hypothetical protein VNO77_07744 [Canavalia gladiata]|uniref:Uncharacterized protein n=1 Tax=Canavalia gladiata TaxID=3824 RepID=A0AAN9MEM9_CANGL